MIKHAILVSVVSGFIITVLSLSGVFTKGRVVVRDESGQPVAEARVWVSYNSVAHAPEFATNRKGETRVTMKNYEDIVAIIVKKGNLQGSVSSRYFSWPLQVTLHPETD
ncbi:MAG TPA: hypothetical protein VGE39_12210 [Prosthecobacter sp.]